MILFSNRSQALLSVITILGFLMAIGTATFLWLRAEKRMSLTYLNSIKATYLAEAGIAHALEILSVDKRVDSIDSFHDLQFRSFQDDEGEAKWFNITDSNGYLFGRYQVEVIDEASKVNLNAAGDIKEELAIGIGTYEINSEKLFSQFIGSSEQVATEILEHRYGEDKSPGVDSIDDDNDDNKLSSDGIDNDYDGEVDEFQEGFDEADEFNYNFPNGDDRPFIGKEELLSFKNINRQTFTEIDPFITTYTREDEIDYKGRPKINLNYSSANAMYEVLLDRGIKDPGPKAIAIKDYIDKDNVQTYLGIYSLDIGTPQTVGSGSWTWTGEFYECIPGGQIGSWIWQGIEDGDYYLYLFGKEDNFVGNVCINGDICVENISDGEGVGYEITVEDNRLDISITNNRQDNAMCYFKSAKLYSLSKKENFNKTTIQGIEAVRINEIMIRPVLLFETNSEQNPQNNWFWQSDAFKNNDVSDDEGEFIFQDIPSGMYYLKVFAASANDEVGDVRVGTQTDQHMKDAQQFSKEVYVAGSALSIHIKNQSSTNKCSFRYIELSRQPDNEYIELVNIGEEPVDIGGWSIDASSNEGWPAFVPIGTTIESHGYIVLCVDAKDNSIGIKENYISFDSQWTQENIVQLEFSKSVNELSDLLLDVGGEILLKDDNAKIVDAVEYRDYSFENYESLERSDPTCLDDNDGDGQFDGWYLCEDESGNTPGIRNNNEGMREYDFEKGDFVEHDISEVAIKNNSIVSPVDIVGLSFGEPWKKIDLNDATRLIDSVAMTYWFGSAFGNHIEGWQEASNYFLSNEEGQEAIFKWSNIENGYYQLILGGLEEKQELSISFRLWNDNFTDFSLPISVDKGNEAYYGIVLVGIEDETSSTPSNTLELKIRNESPEKTTTFSYIILAPRAESIGRININTASKEVLLSLPAMTSSVADEIIANRPYGNSDGLNSGIGDIAKDDVLEIDDTQKGDLLGNIAGLVTVRSDYYSIVSTGQILENDKVVATKRIETVVKRK